MDFVEQQEQARHQTRRFILYFVLAIGSMIAVIYFLLAVFFLHQRMAAAAGLGWLWDARLFACVSAGTIVVVTGGSLLKIIELSHGGRALAMRMGGRQVGGSPAGPDQRKLMNVVEEMAIASGVPVPAVFVLEAEGGINAFAAGHSASDAAIGVSRGCINLLTRDELQGVIAHEFSHILNGDMRLNMRLMGWVFGILCLTIIGKLLLRSRGRKNPAPVIGLVLVVVGSIGVFFGRLIQSAVSRQREFLADASAVQFTRNPGGLAGALKKIGGLSGGSRLSTPYADEAGHLFFGNALRDGWFSLWSTHPPLRERIRRIDPGFDGLFPRIVPAPEGRSPVQAEPAGPARQRVSVGGFGVAGPVLAAGNALAHLGLPLPDHLVHAGGLLATLPDPLKQAAREPFDANALIYAILLSANENVRGEQLSVLEGPGVPALAQLAAKLYAALAPLARDARLALAQLALPSLRRLTPDQYEQLARNIQRLIEADRELDLFEYALQKMLRRHLASQFEGTRKPIVQYYVLKPLVEECVVLLSALAHFGQEDSTQAEGAFQSGANQLGLGQASISRLDAAECNLLRIDAALEHLAQASPQLKKLVLNACAHAVASDGMLQSREAELLRAIADTLDCPLPPFLETAAS